MENVVHVEDLTLAYQDKPVVWDIDLDIPARSRTAIIGPNGAGKSTLLKGILGLMNPLSGSVTIFGQTQNKVRKRIAYIPQTAGVNWSFPTTVQDVVTMGRYAQLGWFKRPGQKDRALAAKALERMGMSEFSNRQISQLSGGQRQRVFLARALASEAEIFFMDEPLAGVDITTEKIIMQTIKEFQQEGKTIVAVHHDLNTLKEYFDYVILINRRVIAQGSAEQVLTPEIIDRAYKKTVSL